MLIDWTGLEFLFTSDFKHAMIQVLAVGVTILSCKIGWRSMKYFILSDRY